MKTLREYVMVCPVRAARSSRASRMRSARSSPVARSSPHASARDNPVWVEGMGLTHRMRMDRFDSTDHAHLARSAVGVAILADIFLRHFVDVLVGALFGHVDHAA